MYLVTSTTEEDRWRTDAVRAQDFMYAVKRTSYCLMMRASPGTSEKIRITFKLVPLLIIGSLHKTITESQRYVACSLTQIRPSANNIMSLFKPAVLCMCDSTKSLLIT